jgi:hypothetical protein
LHVTRSPAYCSRTLPSHPHPQHLKPIIAVTFSDAAF